MTAAEVELSDRQRAVLRTIRASRAGVDARAIGSVTGAGPQTVAALVRLGFVEKRAAGGRDALYHLTRAGNEVSRDPDPETDLFDETTDQKENTMSGTETEKTTKPSVPAKPRTRKANDGKAKHTGGGKGRFVRHPRDEKEDALVGKAIEAEFGKDFEYAAAAMTYGRKWLRYRKGMRSSTPPIGTLSKENAAGVAKAIDAAIEKK